MHQPNSDVNLTEILGDKDCAVRVIASMSQKLAGLRSHRQTLRYVESCGTLPVKRFCSSTLEAIIAGESGLRKKRVAN